MTGMTQNRFGLLLAFATLMICVAQPVLAQSPPAEPTPSGAEPTTYSGTNIIDFGLHPGGELSLTGDLTNLGTIYAISSNPAITTAIFNAPNITNQAGAIITSVLPTGGLPGYTNLVSGLSLSFNVANNFMNSGVINSAGSLSIAAGGSITNALPAGVIAPSPVMQAINNIDIASQIGNIINSGTIASAAANINITAALNNALLFNNTNGTLQALNGNVSVRDSLFTGTSPLTMLGGDVLSRNLDLFGGNGFVTAQLASVSGVMNVIGNGANLGVSSGDLNIGLLKADGDPTYYSANGTITFPNTTIATNGFDLAIISRGSISGGDLNIDTTVAGGNAGNVLMVAGASFVNPTSGEELPEAVPSPITFTNPNPAVDSGGSINVNSLVINASGNASGSAGNVTLVAYAGFAPDSGQIAPVDPSSSSINVSIPDGANGATPGNVTLIAGSLGADAINFGNITSSGGTIQVSAGTPVIDGSAQITVVDGTVQFGSGSFTVQGLNNSNITLQQVSSAGNNADQLAGTQSTNGGSITIQTLGNVTSDSITVRGGNGVNGADDLNPGGIGGTGFDAGDGGTVVLSGADIVTQDVDASGGTGGGGGQGDALGGNGSRGGSGGAITITASSSITANDFISVAGNEGGSGGAGGIVGGNAYYDNGFGLPVGGGGSGGTLTLTAPDIQVLDLEAFGGRGGNGGEGTGPNSAGGRGASGGAAGAITINATNAVDTNGIEASGGDGGFAGNGALSGGENQALLGGLNGRGGTGGNVTITGADVFTFQINSKGGNGGAGGDGPLNVGGPAANGGDGGAITITTTNSLTASDDYNVNGGDGGAGGLGAFQGGRGGNAGNGGSVTLNGVACCVANVFASGGNGGDGGLVTALFSQALGGNGGTGGSIGIQSSQYVSTGTLMATGGKAGISGLCGCGIPGIGNSGGTITINNSNDIIQIFGDVDVTGYGTGNKAGTITLNSSNSDGVFVLGPVIAQGQNGASGGQVNLTGANMALLGTDASGNAINASGDSLVPNANGGTVNIVTLSPNSLDLNCGCSNNFIGGNISADGYSGGRINMASNGGFNFDAGFFVTANGNGQDTPTSTAQGGGIQFTSPSSSTLNVVNNAVVMARATQYETRPTGRIAFNAGPSGNVVMTGSGDLVAGEFVGFGNIDPVSLEVINYQIVPLANAFNVGPADVSQGIISFQIRVSRPLPPTSTGTGSGLGSSGSKSFEVPFQLPQISSNSTISNLDSTPIFVTLGNHQHLGQGGPSKTFIDGVPVVNLADAVTAKGIDVLAGENGEIVLNKGNLLVRPLIGAESGLEIHTKEGVVNVAPGALAFVMETGNDVAVYAFHESQMGDITFTSGKQRVVIATGQQIVLTRDEKADFAHVNPGSLIPARSAEPFVFDNGVKAFIADYSMAVALSVIRPIKEMRYSHDPDMRRATGLIEKDAAILSMLGVRHGPYKAAGHK